MGVGPGAGACWRLRAIVRWRAPERAHPHVWHFRVLPAVPMGSATTRAAESPAMRIAHVRVRAGRPWPSRWRSGLPSVRAQERRELQDAIAMHKRREADSAKEVATLRHQARPHDQAPARVVGALGVPYSRAVLGSGPRTLNKGDWGLVVGSPPDETFALRFTNRKRE